MERNDDFPEQINIRLGSTEKRALQRLAKADERSLSSYIRLVLTAHVKEVAIQK